MNSLAFSPDGKWLVSSSMVFDPNEKNQNKRFNKGEVQLWNVAERKHERLLYSMPETGILAVSFAPDGKTVAVGTTQRSDLRLIDVDTGKEIDKHTEGAAGSTVLLTVPTARPWPGRPRRSSSS